MNEPKMNERGFSLTTVVVAWVVGIACAALPLASVLDTESDETLSAHPNALEHYEAGVEGQVFATVNGTRMVCEPADEASMD